MDLPDLLGKFAELSEKNPYKKFKEVIDLDVSRTFTNFEQKDKDVIFLIISMKKIIIFIGYN